VKLIVFLRRAHLHTNPDLVALLLRFDPELIVLFLKNPDLVVFHLCLFGCLPKLCAPFQKSVFKLIAFLKGLSLLRDRNYKSCLEAQPATVNMDLQIESLHGRFDLGGGGHTSSKKFHAS
jgi:hypothetical protein